MFTIAVKGAYPKFPAPPRPALVNRAIQAWRIGALTDEELERALQRGEVEVVAEMVAAGAEMVWDGQLRWDSPAFPLRSLKGVRQGVNRFIGEQRIPPAGDEFLVENSSGGNGHRTQEQDPDKFEILDRIEWQRPIIVDTYRFLAGRVPVDLRPVLTGPITLAQLCDEGCYGGNTYQRTLDIAKALNREIEGLAAVGALQILIEEPLFLGGEMERSMIEAVYSQMAVCVATMLFLSASNAVTTDLEITKNLPFRGYCIDPAGLDPAMIGELLQQFSSTESIIELGIVNARRAKVESPEDIGRTLSSWGRFYPPDRIWASTTAGLGGVSREIAFLKLQALAQGCNLARLELASEE